MNSSLNAVWCMTLCAAIILTPCISHAVYFTLQLKNGNELITDHYTEDGNGVIHFYTNEGAVAIQKTAIKSIKSNDGSVAFDTDEDKKNTGKAVFAEESAEEPAALPPQKEGESDKDRINSINDQIFIINANLENLAKNRGIFLSQQEQFQQQKQKTEDKIAALKKSSDANAQGTRDTIDLEQAKVKDLEAKLVDLDMRIKNNDQITEAQQRIKQRFEADLQKLKK